MMVKPVNNNIRKCCQKPLAIKQALGLFPITGSVVSGNFIVLENGDNVLLENGDKIKQE